MYMYILYKVVLLYSFNVLQHFQINCTLKRRKSCFKFIACQCNLHSDVAHQYADCGQSFDVQRICQLRLRLQLQLWFHLLLLLPQISAGGAVVAVRYVLRTLLPLALAKFTCSHLLHAIWSPSLVPPPSLLPGDQKEKTQFKAMR